MVHLSTYETFVLLRNILLFGWIFGLGVYSAKSLLSWIEKKLRQFLRYLKNRLAALESEDESG